MESKIRGFEFENLMTEEKLKSTARHVKDLLPKDATHASHEEIHQLQNLFDSVFAVASAPALTAPHRVAAWNALCALIDQCAASQKQSLIDQIWRKGIWDRAFELYLCHSRNARPKSSKQLLIALTTALRKSSFSEARRLKVVRRLVHGIASLEDLPLAKASILVLSYFLNKALLSLKQVLEPFAESNEDKLDSVNGTQCLLSTIFNLVGRGDFNSAIGQAIATVLDIFSNASDHEISMEISEPIWIKPLRNSIVNEAVDLDQLRIHILPVLFRRNLRHYAMFVRQTGYSKVAPQPLAFDDSTEPSSEDDKSLLGATLQTGKELGMAHETAKSEIEETPNYVLVPLHIIETLFRQSSRSSRLSGLSFLISAHSMTRPFPLRTLATIRRHLSNFFADTDANLRGEVFSLMQSLMDRMRAITAALARNFSSNNNTQQLFDGHKAFLRWLLAFLTRELRPTASYQRHISALKTITIMYRSGIDPTVHEDQLTKSAVGPTKWPFHMTVIPSNLRVLLIGLLMDPFDDVRQSSASILSMSNPSLSIENASILHDLEKAMPRAENIMLSTGRADHADGVAHLTSLIYKYQIGCGTSREALVQNRSTILLKKVSQLEAMLKVAQDNIVAAARDFPLHGRITSLRYILMQSTDRELKSVHSNIISCLFKVWEIVKPILCNDAPEGYQVDDTDELADFSTKDTLSYCWRALKESSLLLGSLISSSSTSREQLIRLSDLCFEQLAELRHRGAFSTVAQTWTACCLRCAQLEQDNKQLLFVWYNKIQNILKCKVMINTRRSAGIPSLLCGLLIAGPTDQLMAMAFKDMSSAARIPVDAGSAQQGSLPQVHAMNCLKDVLKNTKLGERSEQYVPAAMRLAADSLRSEAWAIRNCGLMLFRAVIDRLFGTNDGRFDDDFSSAKKFTAEEYPELFDIILSLIAPSSDTKSSLGLTHIEGVFPALQMLQRIRLSKSTASEAAFAVLDLTASSSWHIRDKAARTYAMIVDETQILEELKRILDLCTTKNQNALHGLLLCAKYLVKKSNAEATSSSGKVSPQSLTAESPAIIRFAKRLLFTILDKESLFHANRCSFTRAAYIDVLTSCMSTFLTLLKGGIFWDIEDMADTIRPTFFAKGNLDILSELMKSTAQSEEVTQADSHLFCLPEVSVVRAALAQLLPYALVLFNHCKLVAVHSNYLLSIQKVIRSLTTVDPDAAIMLLHTFRDLNSMVSNNAIPLTCSILLESGTHVFERLRGSEVSYALGEAILAYPLQWGESQYTDDQKDIALLLRLIDQSRPTHELVVGDSLVSQRRADQNVQLRASFLDILGKNLGTTNSIQWPWTEHLTNLVFTCKLSMNDTPGLCSREAAGRAISRFNFLWPVLRNNTVDPFPTLIYELVFVLYDLLNDDDEEIRILAARTTNRLLSAKSTSLEHSNQSDTLDPLVAADELVHFMLKEWHENTNVTAEAFYRAFEFMPPSPSSSLSQEPSTRAEEEHNEDYWSVSSRLRRATRLDTALFAAEKSNLYIDEAREARVWSRVVSRLAPSQQITTQFIQRLARWVIDGWRTFTQHITARHGDGEAIHLDDGGGNSTSRAEVFTLSLQLVYATDLLLDTIEGRSRWKSLRVDRDFGHGGGLKRFPFRPSEVRVAVEEFYVAYLRSEAFVNVLWRCEVERLLARVAQQALGLARSRVTAVSLGIEGRS